jgi:hypothetical protein
MPGATPLSLTVQRVDAGYLHTEDLFDGVPDLALVRFGCDDERVLALVKQPVALLGDDRPEEDVAGVVLAAHRSSFPVKASNAACVKTT